MSTQGTMITALQAALVNSPTFVASVQPDDPKDRVHVHAAETPDPLDDTLPRPFAVIGTPGLSLERYGEGDCSPLIAIENPITLKFSDNVPPGISHSDSALEFVDWAGDIVEEIVDMSYGDIPDYGTTFPFVQVAGNAGAHLRVARSRRDQQQEVYDFWVTEYLLLLGI